MAHPYNHYQQNMHGMPPLQTQGQGAMQNQQRAFSPQSYQQSPGAMSPTSSGGIPPAKRQRLSPQPMSPYSPQAQYSSPFPNSAPQYTHSPYAPSPPNQSYLSLPQSPAPTQATTPSFHQPQPYHPPNLHGDMRPAFQGSMPPPKVPASKAQRDDELEKGNARDTNPAALADIITNSGIDLQQEEEAFWKHNQTNGYGPQTGHGAFQGTGPLSEPKTREDQEAELIRKHQAVARIHSEAASHPLTDPFLLAAGIRQRMSRKVYEHGIKLDLEELQATSLLNHGAPLVDLVSLLSLAAEERVRTVVEDAFAMAQARQNTSHGIVPPNLADLAVANGGVKRTEVAAVNLSKTVWEAPDSAVSPTARLPTPPSDVPSAPQATIQFIANPVTNVLKRKVQEDEKFEAARIAKRQKRLQGNSGTPADTPAITPLTLPEKPITKKERDRINKLGNTDEAQHKRANQTAALALGKKKKYDWMNAGSGGSGAATPRGNTGLAAGSGAATPAAQQKDRALVAKRRQFQGGNLEKSEEGAKIQLRDLIHVLELDGRERKALALIIARMRSEDKDAKKVEDRPRAVPAPAAAPTTPMAR